MTKMLQQSLTRGHLHYAFLRKLNFQLLLEEVENSVSVRKHSEGDLGSMTAEAFSSLINDEININKKEFIV